jgi:hypothetical protein
MIVSPERFQAGLDFTAYLSTVAENAELWPAVYRTARVPEEMVARAREIPGRWNLLALTEDWCGDAVNALPIIARLVEEVPTFELRLLGRDANPDLMDGHLTGTSRSIPVVMVSMKRWWNAAGGAATGTAPGLVPRGGDIAGERRALSPDAPVVRA